MGQKNKVTMEAYLDGKRYNGKAAYINGYNGYDSTDDDGVLCALIVDCVGVPSCWDDEGKPNVLTDIYGDKIVNKDLRGVTIKV